MTERALLDLDLKGMGIVTAGAGSITIDVSILGVVGLAFILIPALGHTTVEGGSSGVVMDIAEAETNIITLIIFDGGNNDIHVGHCEFFDLRVNADLGFASLMTFHTTNIITGCDLNAGGEHNGGLGNGSGIVTSHALHALGIGGGYIGIHFTGFGAV